MPSLKVLQEFKSSLEKIGRENEIRAEQNLPEDDLPLPDKEPAAAGPETESMTEPAAAVEPETAVLAAEPESAFSDAESDNNFLDVPNNIMDLPPADDEPVINAEPTNTESTANAEPAADGTPDADDFLSFGDLGDLLGNGSDTPNLADDFPAITDTEETAESGNSGDLGALLDTIPDDPGLDEIDLLDKSYNEPGLQPDNDSGANETEDITGPGTDFSEDDFNIPSELLNGLSDSLEDSESPQTGESTDEFSLSELPDFSEPEEASAGLQDTAEPEETVDSFDLGGEFIEDAPAADEPDVLNESPELVEPLDSDGSIDSFESMDSFESIDSAELLNADESVDSGESVDSFDQFNLNPAAGTDTADFSLESQDFEIPQQETGSSDDFALPGIDDVFGPRGTPAADTGVDEILADSDEIRLTDDEVQKLRETLASYPLNLRIACGELIAEEVVDPDQMTALIKYLTSGAPPKTTAALAGKILGRTIAIPRGFEKMTGEQLEIEQGSFAYIFIHNFLPVLRTFLIVALVLVSVGYLAWTFIYLPLKAESIYKRGYEQISAGEYSRSRDLFKQASAINPKKIWYYRYARSYRDERQYIYAEEKYDELLNFTALKNKNQIPEKAAVLEYAAMETNYLRNYSKAETLLRRNILDYSNRDRDALLALGDNSLAWGDTEKEHYEDARESYAILLERYGRTDQILERMLKYFIRTDNLGEVLPLQNHFMSSDSTKISAETLAELGGYLLDKRTEVTRGIPNEYLNQIGGIREVLLRAVRSDPVLPESYYHLSRYYNLFSNYGDEELTLQRAIQCFDAAKLETQKRLGYRLLALRRYAEIFTQRGEFFQAEKYLIDGTKLYEDGLSRRILTASPEYGRLYADLGDLNFFTMDGNAQAALDLYSRSEQNGYAPPEIQYRMGAAYYQLKQWPQALDRFTAASFPLPYNERILYALGNTSYLRGNYFAAQAYYDRLLDILEADKTRFALITPTEDKTQLEIAERLMVVQNNLAVTLDALTLRTGDNSYRTRALGLYADSQRAWDILTRDPVSMVRLRPSPDINGPGINPAYLNVQNSLYPVPGYDPLFFMRIDKDMLQPSVWDDLAPSGYSLAEGVSSALSR
ncbi:MAG: tetratricopeptide repeat protein [Treponema sp.]|nr:tetratricopeptide repeat protein [Treponema sp.]